MNRGEDRIFFMEKFVCNICKKEFKSLIGLSKHYTLTHNLSREKLYEIYHPNEPEHVCKNCGKPTTLKNDKLEYNEFCGRKCAIEYHWKNKDSNKLNKRTEKLKSAWESKSEEELKEFSEKCKELYHSRSSENIESIKQKMKSTWGSKDKSEWLSKHKESWKNKPEEEKKILSDKLKKIWEKRDTKDILSILHTRMDSDTPLELYEIITSKNKFKQYLIEYKDNNGDYPTPSILTENFKFKGYSTVIRYIHRYNLEEYIFWNKSLPEQEVEDFIKTIYGGEIIRNDRKILKGKELDIYIPEKNLAIEFNGCYWHSKLCVDKKYHQEKSLICQKNNIRLIHIYEDEWIYKQDIIKDILKTALGIYNKIIYARKCEVKVVDKQTYKDYCQKYHLQGYKGANIILGLYYQDQLIQLASFSKSRYDKNYEYEWIRGIQLPGYQVIGGTSKLFSYFINNYQPKSIICYSDFNKFSGNSYKNCGFILDKITTPDIWFNELVGLKRINRQPSKHQLTKQLVESGDLLEMHGAGNMKWVWRK